MRMTWQQAAHFDAQVDLLRKLANTSTRFTVAELDGQPALVDDRLQRGECVRIDGPSAPDLMRHLFHLNHYALLSLVGLLEAARGTKAQPESIELLRRLKLDQNPLQQPPNR
ncbi:hypothetical protein SK803_24950 [Lentzea sp. BCCO 10_0856]|uniref:Uncharacterized protein n=1 Tax=Lentzea miocenica TaxID=3095431 RepID=A0ABU4T5N5_9PSEU|nr:hypothetical protein [Lentzea sp. BCCO 10_0856]MDX8033480.1 hypothetical protein [Lentzea sp. BCCO 10_0856]